MDRAGRRLVLVMTIHGAPDHGEEPALRRALLAADFNIAVSRYLAELIRRENPQAPVVDAIVRNELDGLPHQLAPI